MMTQAQRKEMDRLSKRRCYCAIDRRYRRWDEASEARWQALCQAAKATTREEEV